MIPNALLFGAVGTLAETSDMQRRAFNAAFAEAGLDWHWGRDNYTNLLTLPGGRARIAAFAERRGDSVDAAALHAAKVGHFRRLVEREGLTPRPGVLDLMQEAHRHGIPVGLATTTTPATVALVLEALSGQIGRSEFRFVGDAVMVAQRKPAPDIYLLALERLGVEPGDALAIEDTPESAQSALAAGIATIAFPGEAAHLRSFPPACRRVDALTPDLLR